MKLLSLFVTAVTLCAAPPKLNHSFTYEQFSKLVASNGRSADYSGYSVAISGDTAVVGSRYHEEGALSNSGALFVYTLDASGSAFVQRAMLRASDAASQDELGISVAISGDTIVAGAFHNDESGSDAGAAYVFIKPQGGWSDGFESVKLSASDANASDEFGYAVAISGDIIAVGSRFDDDQGNASGSVYLFEKPQSGWQNGTETAKIVASDGFASDQFGSALALYGTALAVGAPNDDDGAANSGSVYLFERSAPGVYNQQAKFGSVMPGLYPTPAFAGHCGASVALGEALLVMGCPDSDALGSGAGSAFVFERSAETWSALPAVVRLGAFDPAASDAFGSSVAVEGNSIVVGAKNADTMTLADTGALYLFERTQGQGEGDAASYDFQTKLTATDGATGDLFGFSCAMSQGMIVTGSYYDGDKGARSGSAYLFGRAVGYNTVENRTNALTLDASDPEKDSLSYALIGGADVGRFNIDALSGALSFRAKPDYEQPADANTDNLYEAVVRISDTTGQSAIYTLGIRVGDIGFEGTSPKADAFVAPQNLQSDTPQEFGLFGRNVAIGGDIALVAAPMDGDRGMVYLYMYDNALKRYVKRAALTPSDANAEDFASAVALWGDTVVVGSVDTLYLFEKPLEGWRDANESAKLTRSEGPANDGFGRSVAINADTVVTGAPDDDNNGNNRGIAYVYAKPAQGGWVDATETAILYDPQGQDDDRFGHVVAAGADLIAVSSSGNTDNDEKLCLFEKPLRGWIEATPNALLRPSGNEQDSEFGDAVAIDGDTIAVGAPYRNIGGVSSGAVYIFEKPSDGWGYQTEDAIITSAAAAENAYFGQSVALSGNLLLVGAPGNDNESGRVSLFSKASQGGGGVTESALISAPVSTPYNRFGLSVGLYADKMIIGELLGDTGVENGGSVYLYKAKSASALNASVLMYLLD